MRDVIGASYACVTHEIRAEEFSCGFDQTRLLAVVLRTGFSCLSFSHLILVPPLTQSVSIKAAANGTCSSLNFWPTFLPGRDCLHPDGKSNSEALLNTRRKVAKMLMAVVIMFGICYLPVHLLNILR